MPSAECTSSIIRNTWIQRDTCIGFVGWRLRKLSISRRFPKSCSSLAMTISLSGNLLSSSDGRGGGLLARAAFESASIALPCNVRDQMLKGSAALNPKPQRLLHQTPSSINPPNATWMLPSDPVPPISGFHTRVGKRFLKGAARSMRCEFHARSAMRMQLVSYCLIGLLPVLLR